MDEELELELPPEEEAPQEEEPAYVTELKRQIEAERAGRQAAEQKLHQAAREIHQARGEVEDTNLQLVVNAIDTVTRDLDLMKQAHTYAMQSGDFARLRDLIDDLLPRCGFSYSGGFSFGGSKPRHFKTGSFLS